MNRWMLVSLALPLVACSSTAVSADGGDAADIIGIDVCACDDVSAAEAAVDVAPDVADDTPIDAGSLVGTWRMVALDVNSGGATLHFTDENAPITGTAAVGRCNGLMSIETNRLALAYGLLTNDHFLPQQDAAAYANAIATSGATAAGTLTGTTFSFASAGTSLTWIANADGTIATHDATTGSVTTWARAGTLPSMAALLANGLAVRYLPATSSPLMHPRAALAWDNAGTAGVTLSNDSALTFGPMGYAVFPANVVAIPPAATADIGGTQVAIAYVIVYDDVDASGTFNPAAGDGGTGDVLRGFSPVGIAFRSAGAPSAAFALSALRDLGPGYQFVSVHVDYAAGTAGISPFDPTHPVAPDVAVDVGPISSPFPDLVP